MHKAASSVGVLVQFNTEFGMLGEPKIIVPQWILLSIGMLSILITSEFKAIKYN